MADTTNGPRPGSTGQRAPATGVGGASANAFGSAGRFLRRSDIWLPVGIVLILALLLVPLPTWLLDLTLAISITLSVIVLMVVIFIKGPLELTSFPTILLLVTMLRLGLNVASTRLILSEGHNGTDAAGQVIEAFGTFVTGGNYVIGIIVFAILVLINFVVITKGAGRIAEVAARFTLDAMPGKQMAIDADLSSGLINEDQARQRRRDLEQESSFFGAMDGASKFVRGDAVAGLMITFINIIGGIIIGTAQMGLTLAEAGETYTVLTIGDGLVSQVPALIVSIAAGMLVTKAGVSGQMDQAVFGQMSNYPIALGLASALLLLLALIPGLPFLPFFAMALACAITAFVLSRSKDRKALQDAAAEAAAADPGPPPEEPISTALQIDLIRLELGYGLLPLINARTDQRLTDQIKALRRQLAAEMGFVMPAVRIQDNLQLAANTYVVRIKEIECGRGDIRPNMLLVMDPRGEKITLPGESTTEPTFGLPAVWIQERQREEAMFRGYTVVDPSTVVTTHITELVKDNMSELLSYAETQKLLEQVPAAQQKLVEDLVPSTVSVTTIQRILQTLLGERVSIRDLPTILEGIAEASAVTRSVMQMTEHVRARLARQLCTSNLNTEGVLPLIALTPDWEQAFLESLIGQGEERQLAMAPSKLQEFITKVRGAFERQAMAGETPVLLTGPHIRPYVRSVVERFRPVTVVMSQNEIHPKVRIRTVDAI